MSDYELLSLMLMMLGIITPVLVSYINAKSNRRPRKYDYIFNKIFQRSTVYRYSLQRNCNLKLCHCQLQVCNNIFTKQLEGRACCPI